MCNRHGKGTIGWLLHVTTFYYGLAIVHCSVWAYLWDMTNRNESPDPAIKTSYLNTSVAAEARKLTALKRSAMFAAFIVLVLVTISKAAELPEAPRGSMRSNAAMIEVLTPVQEPKIVAATRETKTIDTKFVTLAIISTGSTFADSYTTLFARQNWLAGKKGVCNVEVQSAYLYGTHPTVGRAYAVASVKSVGSVFAAYYFHRHHHKFWSVPLVANSIMSLEGVSQNLATCN